MTNQHHNHTNEDDSVKDHDSKDWDQKGSPEGSTMRQEAAAYKSKINASYVSQISGAILWYDYRATKIL